MNGDTVAALSEAAKTASGRANDRPLSSIELPLVSVVVVNFNYARFVEEAVASVFAQTYPNIECVVVDDASTDDSPMVLSEVKRRFPDAEMVHRPRNGGQTMASIDGLAASRGQYVIFLDADDILIPRCVDIHMVVHLSSRSHVGFTSGDMLQVVDGQVVVSTGSALNSFIRRKKPTGPSILRPYRHPFESWPDREAAPALTEKVYAVPPLYNRWVWAPTSGNCYRRDALMLFADNPGLARLRTCTDMYFSHAIGGLCGSILIDEPVFAYRIHGKNMLTQRAQLNWSIAYDHGGTGDNNDLARRLIVDQIVAHVERFTASPPYWVALLWRLNCRGEKAAPKRWMRRSQAAVALTAHAEAVHAVFGGLATTAIMLLFRVPLGEIRRYRGRQTGPDA